MLSKPIHGWMEFHLPGTGTYALSQVRELPAAWLKRAINGLKRMEPFSVDGFLEPGELRCTADPGQALIGRRKCCFGSFPFLKMGITTR